MEHSERFQLAQDLCARMAASHPNDLLVGGVYGSTARGEDTLWSDLELYFVVRSGSPLWGRDLLYKGTAVGLQVIAEDQLLAHLTGPTLRWPFTMGVLSALRVLQGEPARVQDWLGQGQSLPAERFRRVLEQHLPGLVVESYGRILSCRERGNAEDIYLAVVEVLLEMNQALCLLNRRWVSHDYYQGLVDAFDFARLPQGYRELVPALWRAREVDEIVPLAERLYAHYWQLLESEGIHWYDYQRVEEVVF